MKRMRPSPPPIDNKGGLTSAMMLQSGLGREPLYALESDIRVEEIEEAWTQRGTNSDGGPCPRSEIRTS